jgi:hypothetical protein
VTDTATEILPDDDVIADVDLTALPEDPEPDFGNALEDLSALGDELRCPECGKSDFNTLRGRNIHLSRMHGIKVSSPGSGGGKTTRRSSSVNLEPELAAMFGTIALAVTFYNQADGMVILQNSEAMAKAWAELARTNKHVEKVLRTMTQGSALGGVAIATLPVVIGIMANHNMMNPDIAAMVQPPQAA